MARSSGRPTGRPPKPTELKVLEGNPGKRSLRGKVIGEIPRVVPKPATHLGEAGKSAWQRYWEHGRAWLALSDIEAVTQLCELHDEAQAVRRRIKNEGLLQVSDNTGRSFVHAAYNDLRGIRSEMRLLWASLYMTSSDRARANVEKPKDDAVGEWESTG